MVQLKSIFTDVFGVLGRMFENRSFAVGSFVSILTAFYSKVAVSNGIALWLHVPLTLMFCGICGIDWMLGTRISKKTNTYESNIAADRKVRFAIFLMAIGIAYGFDQILNTGAIVFTFFTFALMWDNFQSVVANIYVLGWQKYFPMWLFKWVESEINAKLKKYLGGN